MNNHHEIISLHGVSPPLKYEEGGGVSKKQLFIGGQTFLGKFVRGRGGYSTWGD